MRFGRILRSWGRIAAWHALIEQEIGRTRRVENRRISAPCSHLWGLLFNSSLGGYPTQLKHTEIDVVIFVITEIVAGWGRLHPRKSQFEIATWYDPGGS